VIADPGHTLYITGGQAIINGKRQNDDFTPPCQDATDRPRQRIEDNQRSRGQPSVS
jgi:hypothetical protein